MLFTSKSGTQEMTTTNIHTSDLVHAATRINAAHDAVLKAATEAIRPRKMSATNSTL